MSELKVKLGVLLISEIFGPTVGTAAKKLGQFKIAHLQDLRDVPQLRECMAVLVTHGLVQTSEGANNNRTCYSLNIDNAIRLARYPRYLLVMKTLFGTSGEILMEELLKQGPMQILPMIHSVMARDPDEDEEVLDETARVQKIFQSLKEMITDSFVVAIEDDDPLRAKSFNEYQDIYFKVKRECSKKNDSETIKSLSDADMEAVHYKVNFERFEIQLRDQIISAATSRKFDDSAGALVSTILEHLRNTEQASVSAFDLRHKVSSLGDSRLKQHLDQYLKVLEEDSTQFVTRVGDEGGGMYTTKFGNVLEHLVSAAVGNMVQEKFSSKSLRIFR